jgi:glycosyltransferase involved in cell wall biosynthesis
LKIAVVIPAYQEEKNISNLLAQILRYCNAHDIIVVDDGSTDSTSSEASRHLVNLIQHKKNLGKGAALRTGIEFALKNGYEGVITLDADLQHDPNCLPEFIEEYSKNSIDLILGKRNWKGSAMPILRVLSNVITSHLISWRTGRKILDSQSGYRFLSSKFLKENIFYCNGFDFETEVILKASLEGYSISSVDIPTLYRVEKSKIKGWRDTFRFIKIYLKSFGW